MNQEHKTGLGAKDEHTDRNLRYLNAGIKTIEYLCNFIWYPKITILPGSAITIDHGSSSTLGITHNLDILVKDQIIYHRFFLEVRKSNHVD